MTWRKHFDLIIGKDKIIEISGTKLVADEVSIASDAITKANDTRAWLWH